MAIQPGRSGKFIAPEEREDRDQNATVLTRRAIADKLEEAEASFAYLVAVRDNVHEPAAQRLEAAKEILNRVVGKPVPLRPNDGSKKRLDDFLAKTEEFFREHGC
jgi:hypothetical protein